MKHPVDQAQLALYAGGDLRGLEWLRIGWHLRGCAECRGSAEAFRLDRERLADRFEGLPEGVQWDRLAAEMAANVRVGLAAGECVAPATEPASASWNWRPAGAVAGLAFVFGLAWWLNVPPSDTAVLSKAFGVGRAEERGPVVEATAAGIQFRENGSALGVKTGDAQPVSVSVSFDGSASARYVDDAGQVTIATVYAQ